MNTLTPEGNKLIDGMIRSHDDAVRAAERERIARALESHMPDARCMVSLANAAAIVRGLNG